MRAKVNDSAADMWARELERAGMSSLGPIGRAPRALLWFLRSILLGISVLAGAFAVMPLFGGSAYALCMVAFLPIVAAPFASILWWFTHMDVSFTRAGIEILSRGDRNLVRWEDVHRIHVGTLDITITYTDGKRWRTLGRPRVPSRVSRAAVGVIEAPTLTRRT